MKAILPFRDSASLSSRWIFTFEPSRLSLARSIIGGSISYPSTSKTHQSGFDQDAPEPQNGSMRTPFLMPVRLTNHLQSLGCIEEGWGISDCGSSSTRNPGRSHLLRRRRGSYRRDGTSRCESLAPSSRLSERTAWRRWRQRQLPLLTCHRGNGRRKSLCRTTASRLHLLFLLSYAHRR